MIKDFEQLKEMLRSMPVKRRVAVTPAQDEHTLEAICHAYRDGMVEPVLIGDKAKILEILESLQVSPEGMQIIHMEDPTACIQKAADMARAGEVDCIMKGKTETGPLMKVLVNREHGIRKNDTMSLLAFMDSPNYHKVFGITDVGLLTYPTKEQKKAAIVNAVEAFHALGVDRPKVAIIAAVEKVNPKMKETVEAAEIKEEGV
ncbi:MAG: phosphate acyltransferase, partial [Enterocloster aldenensis]